MTLTIGQFSVLFSGVPAAAASQGPASFSSQAKPPANFSWAVGPSGGPSATSGVVQLRVSPTTLQCYYLSISGSGESRKLSVVVLGGAGQSYDTQCAPPSYAAIPNVATVPYCAVAPGSRSPLVSTIVQTFSYKGSDSSSGAGTASVATLAGAAVAAVLAAVLA